MLLHTHQRMILSVDKSSSHQNTMVELSRPIRQKTLNKLRMNILSALSQR